MFSLFLVLEIFNEMMYIFETIFVFRLLSANLGEENEKNLFTHHNGDGMSSPIGVSCICL